jgi:hypothetical protein
VTAIFVSVLMILSDFGVDLTPLIASVGIAGLALSLGAQTLIKDFIAGFLILFENHYVIGDTIQLENLTGKVERITLRATYVRDIKGFQYTIPNGEVRIVANLNKDWTRALVDRIECIKNLHCPRSKPSYSLMNSFIAAPRINRTRRIPGIIFISLKWPEDWHHEHNH